MKPVIQPLLLLIICLLSINCFAATVTWVGGDDDWENPSNWDTGTVPAIGDDVILPEGEVILNTAVLIQSLIVESKAVLIVTSTADLAIDPSNSALVFALDVAGKAEVYGTVRRGGVITTLASLRVNVSGYWTTQSSGVLDIELGYLQVETPSSIFYNRGELTIESNSFGVRAYGVLYNRGEIICHGINASFTGIEVFSAGQWINYGFVSIAGHNTGVDNKNRWYNRGQVVIDDADRGIENEGRIDNTSSATIQILNGGNWDLIDNAASGRIRNWGTVIAEAGDSFYGIRNDGRIDNYRNATMTFDGDYVFGVIRNWSAGEIYNHGSILLGSNNLDTSDGLDNGGSFINYQDGELLFLGYYDSYSVDNGGNFINYGYCDFDEEVRNTNNFTHTDCGEMKIAGGIMNFSNGLWLNESILRLDGSGSFLSSSNQFVNMSVIEDPFNIVSLAGIDNHGIVAKPENPLYTNVTSNFMDMGVPGTVMLDVHVFDAIEGNPVGEYDWESNKLWLESSAVGLTAIYFVDVNCEFWFAVSVPAGVQPAPSPFSGGETGTDEEALELGIYPNPTTDFVQLWISAAAAERSYSWKLHNQLGQLLLSGETLINEGTPIDLTRFPAGTYFLLVQDAQGGIVLNKQILKQ